MRVGVCVWGGPHLSTPSPWLWDTAQARVWGAPCHRGQVMARSQHPSFQCRVEMPRYRLINSSPSICRLLAGAAGASLPPCQESPLPGAAVLSRVLSFPERFKMLPGA